MSFPLKPSASKSGRLTRQANVTSGGSHSHDIPSTSDSFLQSLNPRSTLLLRAELPKPMSRLPEIRLDDGSGGSGGKVQVGQVKPQKSCESYDSAASGMSWSSSQSTVAVGGGYCNSTSVSGNPSFTSYEEDEEPLQSHPQQSIVQIPSTPSALHRTQYSPRHDNAQHRMGHPFRTNYSFEEVHITSEQPAEKGESSIAPRGSAKKKSFRRFWKLAYRAIRSEIDPVYQLLKSAATQRHLSAKNSTSSDHGGHTGQPPRLSSSGDGLEGELTPHMTAAGFA
ncbi:hypothetical protein EGR_06068 [Echinococcus granulosus]|uniref:Uncharacterized protein n=1 Tax=Echinococcus granulosus TaxID=6210 RepID=W6UE01_ECHGR|nr:hypothetical protein EGR_06068 [Echinococcus granulosus]EUB59076.1 hypothetical protein EGR_06068 [Echinococcus granulosus]